MGEYIQRAVAQLLVELGASLSVIALILLVCFICCIPGMVRRWLCKHDKGVRETRACDAICNTCGKNLGFIGTWRDSQKQQELR